MPKEPIETQHLVHGQEPPESVDWIMVEITTSGPLVRIHTELGGAAADVLQGPFGSPTDATETAKSHARERGMQMIYSKGVPHI